MMMPRASLFGGSWFNGDNAGSRYANVDNWPDNSNENIGARGRGDDRNTARRRLRSRRPATLGQRFCDQGRWSARLSRFGEHTSWSGRAGCSGQPSKPAAGFFSGELMGKRYRNLIGRITAPGTMQQAYRLTARGKRLTPGYLGFSRLPRAVRR